jgi:4-amino-4-deoxy-L-arabinose transferase-like glycosyltransferase
MKLLNFLGQPSSEGFFHGSNRLSKRKFYTAIAVITFFLIITAQVFWATIHGDGAVYAWITRKITEAGIFSSQLPFWSQNEVFAEHPYLFFYLSSLFAQLFGFSDIVMKIPNFLIAGLSAWTVYRVACRRDGDQPRSYQIGLISGYVLLLNAAYELQISQPTLDPMAHLLGYFAVLVLLYNRNSFFAGFILGFAFLTKGLELLPNLAALFLLTCYLDYNNFKSLSKNLVFGFLGLLIPIGAWLVCDHFVWNDRWVQTYISRQFQNRLLSQSNMQSLLGFDYLSTFIRIYFFEIAVLVVGLVKSARKRSADPLYLYFVSYLFFNILAFMIIKKDSSQHLTGVLLLGSVFVGEYLWEAFQKVNRSFLRAAPILLLLAATIYWSYYIFKKNDKPDLWTSIKNESVYFAENEKGVPLVVKNSSHDHYGLYNTSQWYFSEHKVYLQNEADQMLVGQEVILLTDGDGRQLVKEKTIYKK